MVDMQTSPPLIRTEDGSFSLYCTEVGECYHSRSGAKSEAQSLYVEASGIAARWHQPTPISVLDVGLGLGYNALCAIESWMADPAATASLHLTSFEKNAALFKPLRTAQGTWQTNWPENWRRWVHALSPIFCEGEVWRAEISHPSQPSMCRWTCVIGDIRETLAAHVPATGWELIWYDPFSAKKAPELWIEAWLTQLRRVTAPTATLVTYSVARGVREAFSAAGWSWEKVPTNTGKRAWLRVTNATN